MPFGDCGEVNSNQPHGICCCDELTHTILIMFTDGVSLNWKIACFVDKLPEDQRKSPFVRSRMCNVLPLLYVSFKTREGPFSAALGGRVAVGGTGHIVSENGLFCS